MAGALARLSVALTRPLSRLPQPWQEWPSWRSSVACKDQSKGKQAFQRWSEAVSITAIISRAVIKNEKDGKHSPH
eukprot:scaffold155203_cov46-Prasinocladus_malaysianus.AAC.1